MDLKRLSYRHKNNKLLYYLRNYLRQWVPARSYQQRLAQLLEQINDLNDTDREHVIARVLYYNKLVDQIDLSSSARALGEFGLKKDPKTYYFDFYEICRYFDSNLKANAVFGDVTTIPSEPAIVKSRPIGENNENSVILKLNKVRHFLFIKNDEVRFEHKKDLLVSRGVIKPKHQHRIRFLDMYFNHPMCNLGYVNDDGPDDQWKVPRMTIGEHLQYKFILCLEGNDVASNLKWVMSSSSIAVMPKPKYETWFMEGKLIPDYHYIQIKDDYSDLEEKLNYYIDNPQEALNIIKNANLYVQQFKNSKLENLISLMVLDKYFRKTNQK